MRGVNPGGTFPPRWNKKRLDNQNKDGSLLPPCRAPSEASVHTPALLRAHQTQKDHEMNSVNTQADLIARCVHACVCVRENLKTHLWKQRADTHGGEMSGWAGPWALHTKQQSHHSSSDTPRSPWHPSGYEDPSESGRVEGATKMQPFCSCSTVWKSSGSTFRSFGCSVSGRFEQIREAGLHERKPISVRLLMKYL